jgi:hypothetical protein
MGESFHMTATITVTSRPLPDGNFWIEIVDEATGTSVEKGPYKMPGDVEHALLALGFNANQRGYMMLGVLGSSASAAMKGVHVTPAMLRSSESWVIPNPDSPDPATDT